MRTHFFRRLLLAAFALLLLALCLAPRAADAHGVTVDGNPADWVGKPPTTGYDPASGEWIWRAASSKDAIQEMRATGDANYLYVLVRLAELRANTGDGAPQVQIAVDTDRQPNSGASVFAGLTSTRLMPSVATWERLVRTSFGKNQARPAVLDANFNDIGAEDNLAILSPTQKTIEMRVRWSDIGVRPPTTLRLTVAAFNADHRDNVYPEGAPALGVVAVGDNPGIVGNRVAAYLDIEFRADGAAAAPLPPVRVGEVNLPLPPLMREPLFYVAIIGILLVVIGILLKWRGRPRSYWWG
ncbi:MAG: hypothetical protein U0768_14115 [Anaerolineae bacterium]